MSNAGAMESCGWEWEVVGCRRSASRGLPKVPQTFGPTAELARCLIPAGEPGKATCHQLLLMCHLYPFDSLCIVMVIVAFCCILLSFEFAIC